MPLVQDAAAAGRLRGMKRTATALLGVAAALYLLSLALHGTAFGFLRAGSEAAMVGGLADWFAVTALFRHPLGVPIPHTALVPRKKDELATKLGEFVTGHFLTRAVVTEQVALAAIVPKLGAWLAEPANADRVAKEAAFNAGALLDALDDDAVVAYVLELLRRDVARRSYAPVLGRVLDRALAGGTQEPLVEIFARRGHTYLREHREDLIPELKALADKKWYGWLLATDRRIRGGLDALAETLQEVEHDPQHGLRTWLDGLLSGLAHELQTDARTAVKIDRLAARLLDDPRAQAVLHEVVADAMVSVRESLADAEGTVQTRISLLIQQLGRRA